MLVLESRTADQLAIGDKAALERVLREEDIDLFAALSGDCNPVHLDHAYAEASPFRGIIAHGLWGGALISALIGMRLPGPGSIYLSQDFRFRRPIRPGDRVEARVAVVEVDIARNAVRLACTVTANGEIAIAGEAKVLAPRQARRCEVEAGFDAVVIERPARFRALIEAATGRPALPVRLAGGPAAAAGLARAEAAGLATLDPSAPAIVTDRAQTPGAAGLILIDAPAAAGLILTAWGSAPTWASAAAAAGLDPNAAAPLTADSLRTAAASSSGAIFHADRAESALLFAESLDQLGGAAAAALHDPGGPAPSICGDDPDGLEIAAGLALAVLTRRPALT